jgi:hypothetical protein
MANGYTFGNKFSTDLAKGGGQYYQIGRVKSVILGPKDEGYESPADIGKITYSLLYSPLNTSFAGYVSKPAYPMWGFMKQFPVLNEIVLIFTGPSQALNDNSQNQQSFYFPPYNLWNDSEQNAFPDLGELAAFQNQYAQASGYTTDSTPRPQFPLGKTFRLREVDNVRNIQPFEGDTVLQARFGQSIRFGSTNIPPQVANSRNNIPAVNGWSTPIGSNPNSTNGDPITIILNEQGPRPELGKFDNIIEDIEKDGSSIYMTSTQVLDLSFLNTFPLGSFKSTVDVSAPTNSVQNTTSTKYTSAANQDNSSRR